MGKCQLTVDAARCISPVLLSTSLSRSNKKPLKWLERRLERYKVPKGGLEPPCLGRHNALNVACLPVSPLRLVRVDRLILLYLLHIVNRD